MSEILELKDVWKSYDEVQALKGLNLEVKKGEMFGLVGPNGAGKTTAIKIVVGLLGLDKGSVEVNSHNISEEPYEYKKMIGYVPEAVSLPEYLTVEEFLIYSGRLRAVPNDQIKNMMTIYLETFELEEKRKSLLLMLSRGMKQKVALVSALIHDPELLILDEPLVGIDPSGQHIMKELFNKRIENNKTIFISTHMLDTAERMCDRVAIIHRGRNVAFGDLKKLRELSKTGEDATLEEVFLKLTEEAEKEANQSHLKESHTPKRQGFLGFLGRHPQ